MRLTPWLAEFYDRRREAEFLQRETHTQLRGQRIGLTVVGAAVLFATWLDARLLSQQTVHPLSPILTARSIELMGLAVAGWAPLRTRFPSATGWSYLLGAFLLSVGHQLSSFHLYEVTGRPPNVFWTAFFVLLSLVGFVQPVRFALPAAATLVVGGFLQHGVFVPASPREFGLYGTVLLISIALGTVACLRQNRGRRLEFASLEIERQTNLQLSDEVNERLLAEDLLLAHTSELEAKLLAAQRLEAIGRLTGGVAHDLNNLLTPIIGYTDLAMIEAEEQPTITALLREVSRAGENAKSLVAQLLAYGRQQRLEQKKLDLSRLVQREEPALRAFLRDQQTLSLACTTDPLPVAADKTQLLQVLVNLVVNARDALSPQGKIEVQTLLVELTDSGAQERGLKQAGSYALLRVTDDGAGMDEATRQRIFEPFFSTKELGIGTGLGLATVYGIVRQHDGAIQVESTPKQGTSFSIWLPVGTLDEEDGGPASQLPLTLRGGNETILVVDDDAVVAELLRRLLARSGYAVLLAHGAEEALELSRRHHGIISLVICDVVMRGGNGPQLWSELSVERPEARVLFVSGYTGVSLHMDDQAPLLAKPFNRAELVGRVRRVLDQPPPRRNSDAPSGDSRREDRRAH